MRTWMTLEAFLAAGSALAQAGSADWDILIQLQTYPEGDSQTYLAGFAVVTCLSEPDGRLRACEIETEHPRDGGFGEATLAATRGARLENTAAPGGDVPLRKIRFRADFNIESESDAIVRNSIPTRLPPRVTQSLNRPN